MEAKDKTKKYKKQSLHYLENAYKFLDAGDLEKASEFLWGSLVEALKAVAASKDIKLRSHRDVWNYATGLARALGDESIKLAFDYARSLHSNFYESGLMLEDVITGVEHIKKALEKLFKYIPETE